MKRPPLITPVFLCSPATAANCSAPSRPHSVSDHKTSLGNHKTLASDHKKPAFLAGFL
jgi:hypothetical protein